MKATDVTQQKPSQNASPPKSPPTAVAALVALFVIGGGQLVNRQWAKAALLFFSGGIFLCATAVLGMSGSIPVYLAFGLLPLFAIYLTAYIDAIRTANRIHRGEPVGRWRFF